MQADIRVPTGRITVRLLPFPAHGAIDIRKLGPDRNSLRAVCTGSLQDGVQQLPTPSYNTSILQVSHSEPLVLELCSLPIPCTIRLLLGVQDMLMRRMEPQWHTAVHTVPALPSHVRLLRCWARHGALHQQPDGFTGFFWSMFAVYLVQQGILVGVDAAIAAFAQLYCCFAVNICFSRL